MSAHAAAVRHDAPPQGGVGVYTQKVGMWVFLVSEVMFFTALIGSYIILRWGTGAPWPDPRTVLAIPITALNTFILICSSVTMVLALSAIQVTRTSGKAVVYSSGDNVAFECDPGGGKPGIVPGSLGIGL